MNDLSSQQPMNAGADQPTQVKDEQGFVKPALPTRLTNQNGGQPARTALQGQAQSPVATPNGTPSRPVVPQKDPAARAAGAQARARALAAAGMSIVRPTTTEVEEYYAQDDALFASMAMDDPVDDPLVGMTSTDLLTAEEVGKEGFQEGETMDDDVRTDGFGAPPPGAVVDAGIGKGSVGPRSVGPPPSLQRGHSAGGFVYPQNQVGPIADSVWKVDI